MHRSVITGSVLLLLAPTLLSAQATDDAMMMRARAVDVGFVLSQDSWDTYWEGSLKRSNDNIGRMTTRSMTVVAGYGVSDRLTVMAMVPYVWTHSTQGTLHGMSGVQDLNVMAKYRLLTTPFTDRATFSAFAVGEAGAPASNYTPDFQPFSIGSASRHAAAHLVMSMRSHNWLFVNGSAGYTWRRNVMLDRNSYYTNGQLYQTNEVEMPDVADYSASAGYRKGRLCIPITLLQQRTLGGGDIRRQDMPFVSNKMDFVKLGTSVMYDMNFPQHAALQLGTMRTLSGRNVGVSTTYTAGLMYTFQR